MISNFYKSLKLFMYFVQCLKLSRSKVTMVLVTLIFSPYFADGGSRTSLAERCRRPEFWLHVQTVGDWQLKCWQNILPVSVRRWLVHFSLCLYRWNRLQSQNRLPTRQTRQATNLGKLNLTEFSLSINISYAKNIKDIIFYSIISKFYSKYLWQ